MFLTMLVHRRTVDPARQKPDAISIDSRPQSKTLYITDDPSGRNSTQGLYALPCQQHTCVALDEYVGVWTIDRFAHVLTAC